ncbi:MAG TPA: hypothetical protein VD861_14225 [Pyrinomonadaceae bacterium]|nr:hypothetical protein [Pyrinomonadaceae bacterium]
MKSCPTCNRTFEDTFTFCLVDGSILSAPYDSVQTQRSSVRDTAPPPTEVYPGRNPPGHDLPPTIKSPLSPHFQPQYGENGPAGTAHGRKAGPFKELLRTALKGSVIGAGIGLIILPIVEMTAYTGKRVGEAALAGIIYGVILGALILPILKAIIKFAWKKE